MKEMEIGMALRDDIAKELMHVARRLMQRASHEMENWNVGMGQAGILKALSDHESMTQRQLAMEARVTPATICGTIKRMEKSGLVSRAQAEGDARVSLIRLSEEGRRRIGEVTHAVEGTYSDMLAGFSDEECQKLCEFIRRMGENLTRSMERCGERTDENREN